MLAQSLCVLLAVGLVAGTPFRSFKGVDPNGLSCDPNGLEFLLLPHFTDCSLFYMCVHGEEVERPCAPGTIFDFELQTCNHPWATRCWLRSQDIEEGSGSGDESDDSWDAQPDKNEEVAVEPAAAASFEPKLNCNDSASASKQLPYHGDCQRLWRCSGGNLVSAFCSDGLFFNAKTQMCDYEANVVCGATGDEELQGEFMVYK